MVETGPNRVQRQTATVTAFLAPCLLQARRREAAQAAKSNSRKRPARSVVPTSQQNQRTPLTRVAVGVAGAALAISLAHTPLHPLSSFQKAAPAHAESATAAADVLDAARLSSLTTEQRKALRAESQRNTRAAGKVSQQFSTARREAEAGDLDAALDTYNAIIAAAPSFAPAYSNRANIYTARKQFQNAMHDYSTCLTLAPLDGDAWVVYVNRGATRLAVGDTDGALADMNAAQELRAGSEIVLANRAGVYEVLGKWDNAIRDYQAALKSNDVKPFWERYGLVLFQRNKPFEAISILKRVAARFDVSDVHAALAVIYFERGDLATAETEWSRVDRPRLFESRAFLEQERKWPPRAIEAMDNFRHLKE